jgi:hypothetical protein
LSRKGGWGLPRSWSSGCQVSYQARLRGWFSGQGLWEKTRYVCPWLQGPPPRVQVDVRCADTHTPPVPRNRVRPIRPRLGTGFSYGRAVVGVSANAGVDIDAELRLAYSVDGGPVQENVFGPANLANPSAVLGGPGRHRRDPTCAGDTHDHALLASNRSLGQERQHRSALHDRPERGQPVAGEFMTLPKAMTVESPGRRRLEVRDDLNFKGNAVDAKSIHTRDQCRTLLFVAWARLPSPAESTHLPACRVPVVPALPSGHALLRRWRRPCAG